MFGSTFLGKINVIKKKNLENLASKLSSSTHLFKQAPLHQTTSSETISLKNCGSLDLEPLGFSFSQKIHQWHPLLGLFFIFVIEYCRPCEV
jgi:hypothetical protein